jgi:hypothetical protein
MQSPLYSKNLNKLKKKRKKEKMGTETEKGKGWRGQGGEGRREGVRRELGSNMGSILKRRKC